MWKLARRLTADILTKNMALMLSFRVKLDCLYGVIFCFASIVLLCSLSRTGWNFFLSVKLQNRYTNYKNVTRACHINQGSEQRVGETSNQTLPLSCVYWKKLLWHRRHCIHPPRGRNKALID